MPLPPPHPLLAQLGQALKPLANPERAASMCAYMKDQFPFLGVAAPLRRAAVAALVKPRLTHGELRALADGLWQCPEREYRYTAIDLLAYALALGEEREFFTRKAIGWALRDFVRTQPEIVRAFVVAHATDLSTLTVREASKHL